MERKDIYKELYEATDGETPTYLEEGVWLMGALTTGVLEKKEGKQRLNDLVIQALDDIDNGMLDREPTGLLRYMIENKIIHAIY